MLDKEIASAILKSVDEGFDEQVAFTQDLVRLPSLRGEEHTAQDFMAAAMRTRGFDVDQWRIDVEAIKDLPGFAPVKISYENAFNVVGSYRPKAVSGRSLILNGHIDVVPTGSWDRWTRTPFDPHVEDGWMYGRGAGDMKAGLGLMLYAYDAIVRAGYAPAAPIHFQSVVEEECTGNGALACLQRGYKADCALIPEPIEPILLRAQVGLIWFQVHVSGDPQHASGYQDAGSNAIEKAFGVWQQLKELEKDWNARKVEHPLYKDHPHPIRFNLGNVSGGEWTSSVPAACTIEVRVGVYPGWKLEDARAEIEACVRQAAMSDPYLSNNPPTVEYHGHMAEGYVLENAEEPEKILAESHRAVFGKDLTEHVTSAATDARFFGLYQDTPGIVYGPVCEQPHGFDERVDLESVRQVTKTYALFIAEWCGLQSR
ncbi:ArgE/DapE family deacylase [Aquibaculum sediminis]|uniref:ArgE/DapE family deacylase n=1 Tax=Aquibaculum sediminis TaxID=3231907 RepID=UPI0034559728